MKKIWMSLVALTCCMGSIYADTYVQLVEGYLHVTFQPTGTAGTTGTWQPCVVTPDGSITAGPIVDYDSTDPVEMDIVYCPGPYVALGSYGFEIKNNITDAVESSVVSKITVEAQCPTVPFDTLTYTQIPSSSNGENILLYYVLPSMGN